MRTMSHRDSATVIWFPGSFFPPKFFISILKIARSVALECLPPAPLEPWVMWRPCQAGPWAGPGFLAGLWHVPDVLCGQGAGTGGAEQGLSLALQLPDLAAIQRDPAKCYFLNTLSFHNNLTTLLSFTSALKKRTGLLLVNLHRPHLETIRNWTLNKTLLMCCNLPSMLQMKENVL